MNKKMIALAALASVPMGLHAATGFVQGGGANSSALTTRAAGLSATSGNPAAGELLLKEGQNFRSGFISTPHVGMEVGPVDNFIEDFEDFEQRYEVISDKFEEAEDTNNQALLDEARTEAEQLLTDFRPLLTEFTQAAYVNVDVQQQVPVTPAIFRGFGGVFTVDIAADAKIQMQTIGDKLVLLDDAGNELNDSQLDQADDIGTNTAAYLKSGIFAELGVTYSRPLPLGAVLPLPEGMRVSAGARAKVIQGQLSRQVILLDGSEDTNGETAADRAEDNYDANQVTSTSFGLDVGVMFDWKGLYGGLSVFNLVPPSFDFGELGGDCAARFDGADEAGLRADCVETDDEFISTGELPQNETYTDDPRVNAELGYRILESNWVVGGALDFNKVESVVGHEYQWATLSAGYESQNWWLPGFTLGLRQNLAGTEQSYATASIGLLRVMRLNLSYGLEEAEVDGDKVPRSYSVGIGFEMPI